MLVGEGHPQTLSPGSGGQFGELEAHVLTECVVETHQHLQARPCAHAHMCACVKGKEKGLRPRKFSPMNVAVKSLEAGAVKAQGILLQPSQATALPSPQTMHRKALSKL